ncbi:chloride channel protein 2-like isoform X1, partial [Tachysurus ichikawai]
MGAAPSTDIQPRARGVYSNGTVYSLIPGSYAVAGAAAMSGAATHTISTAMILFELTGQINFLFPILFCVILGPQGRV